MEKALEITTVNCFPGAVTDVKFKPQTAQLNGAVSRPSTSSNWCVCAEHSRESVVTWYS
jgi:hypothetical protein